MGRGWKRQRPLRFQEAAETHSDATAVPILRNGLKLLSKQDGALTLRRNPRGVQL